MSTRISRIESTIVDLPMRRSHAHSRSTTVSQSYVLVRLTTDDGAIGIGEGVTPGGPWWSGDAVESMKVMIDRYLAPAIVGEDLSRTERLLHRMDRVAARNHFAKAALDMAVHDALARTRNVSLADLFGGRVRDRIEVLWPLGAGTFERDVAEAREKLDARMHRTFKVKIGAGDPAADVERVRKTAEAIGSACRVDLNQAWDEPTAARWLPELERAGIELIEAPIDGRNLEGMRRLADRLDVPVMADEGLWDCQDAMHSLRAGATDILAVKIPKGGGVRRAHKLAVVGEAGGLPLYGGMTLDSSIGTAASLQLYATFPSLAWGSESVGPLMLADDLVAEPLRYEEFQAAVPEGPGLGIELDEEKVRHYTRAP